MVKLCYSSFITFSLSLQSTLSHVVVCICFYYTLGRNTYAMSHSRATPSKSLSLGNLFAVHVHVPCQLIRSGKGLFTPWFSTCVWPRTGVRPKLLTGSVGVVKRSSGHDSRALLDWKTRRKLWGWHVRKESGRDVVEGAYLSQNLHLNGRNPL